MIWLVCTALPFLAWWLFRRADQLERKQLPKLRQETNGTIDLTRRRRH